MIYLEQLALSYFYFHRIYKYLYDSSEIQEYMDLVNKYGLIIVPFTNHVFSLLTLLLYPGVIAVVLLVKKVGFLKPLVILIQVTTYLVPLLFIKLIL